MPVGAALVAATPVIVAGSGTAIAGAQWLATRGRDALTAGQQFRGTNGPVFGRASGILNDNPVLRVGWGWKKEIGKEVFRISIGNRDAPFWIHIDLFHE